MNTNLTNQYLILGSKLHLNSYLFGPVFMGDILGITKIPPGSTLIVYNNQGDNSDIIFLCTSTDEIIIGVDACINENAVTR